MRQAKKEMKLRDEVLALLDQALVGRLATNSRGGYPIIKPVNFVRVGESLYLHSARQGEKIDDIRRDGRVCFEVDQPLAYVACRAKPCRATILYRSAVALGRAVLVEDEAERVAALAALMRKHQPDAALEDFPPKVLAITEVIRIDIAELTGKEHWGTAEQKALVQAALEEGAPLPLSLLADE